MSLFQAPQGNNRKAGAFRAAWTGNELTEGDGEWDILSTPPLARMQKLAHDAEARVDGLTRTVKTMAKGKPGEMDSHCQTLCAPAL